MIFGSSIALILIALAAIEGAVVPCKWRAGFGFRNVPPSRSHVHDATPTAVLPYITAVVQTDQGLSSSSSSRRLKMLVDLSVRSSMVQAQDCFTQPDPELRCTGATVPTAELPSISLSNAAAPSAVVELADGSRFGGADVALNVTISGNVTLGGIRAMLLSSVNSNARRSGSQAQQVLGLGPGSRVHPFSIDFTHPRCEINFFTGDPHREAQWRAAARPEEGSHPQNYRLLASWSFMSFAAAESELILDSTFDGIVMPLPELTEFVTVLARALAVDGCTGDVILGCPLLRSEYGEGRYRAGRPFAPDQHFLAVRVALADGFVAFLLTGALLFESLPCAADAVGPITTVDCVALKLVPGPVHRCGAPCLKAAGPLVFDPSTASVFFADRGRVQPVGNTPTDTPHTVAERVGERGGAGEAWSAANGIALALLATAAFVALWVWREVRLRRAELSASQHLQRRRR